MSEQIDDLYAVHPSPESMEFWRGIEEGRLMLPFCVEGLHWFFPPMPGCPECGAAQDRVEFRPSSGRGQIYSWIVAHYAFGAEFADEVPYAVVTVELDEGPRIYGRWMAAEPELTPGGRVQFAVFDRKGQSLVGFVPDSSTTKLESQGEPVDA